MQYFTVLYLCCACAVPVPSVLMAVVVQHLVLEDAVSTRLRCMAWHDMAELAACTYM